MGKKAAKKKLVPKDFEKVKRKVGKEKKAPVNETKTDYRVAKVRIALQLEEKGPEVTNRNLNLGDALTRCNHYSASTRRDALQSLKQLCSTFPGTLEKNLGTIMAGPDLSRAPSTVKYFGIRTVRVEFEY